MDFGAVDSMQGRHRLPSQNSGEARLRSLARLHGLDLAVARRRLRLERENELARHFRHVFDRPVESGLIGFRGAIEARELAHELQRRGADLVLTRRRLEIEQSADVPAHQRLLWRLMVLAGSIGETLTDAQVLRN